MFRCGWQGGAAQYWARGKLKMKEKTERQSSAQGQGTTRHPQVDDKSSRPPHVSSALNLWATRPRRVDDFARVSRDVSFLASVVAIIFCHRKLHTYLLEVGAKERGDTYTRGAHLGRGSMQHNFSREGDVEHEACGVEESHCRSAGGQPKVGVDVNVGRLTFDGSGQKRMPRRARWNKPRSTAGCHCRPVDLVGLSPPFR